jgi:integrase
MNESETKNKEVGTSWYMDKAGWHKLIGAPLETQCNLLEDLSAQKLKKLSKAINAVRDEMYQRDRGAPKYGNLRRAFYKDEFFSFMRCVEREAVRHAFLTMFFYGLRVGELRGLDYVEEQSILRIQNYKSNRTEYMPVHGKTWQLLKWLPEYKTYSVGYLTRMFRRVRERAGFNYVYDQSKNGKNLYQFSSHSLRKTSIKVFSGVGEELKVKYFARHTGDVTMRYFRQGYGDRDFLRDLESCFDSYYELI